MPCCADCSPVPSFKSLDAWGRYSARICARVRGYFLPPRCREAMLLFALAPPSDRAPCSHSSSAAKRSGKKQAVLTRDFTPLRQQHPPQLPVRMLSSRVKQCVSGTTAQKTSSTRFVGSTETTVHAGTMASRSNPKACAFWRWLLSKKNLGSGCGA